MKHFFISIILSLAIFFISGCTDLPDAPLTVTDTWVRPTPKGQNAAVYFLINNSTNKTDTLISAQTDITQSAEIHMSMVNENDVASMQVHEMLTIPAHNELLFEPRGYHLMLANITRDLELGERITVTLNFKFAGNIVIEVLVEDS